MTDTPLLLSLSAECQYFLRACLLGAALGVFFDIFRILRRSFGGGTVVVCLQDLFFWLVVGYTTFSFLLRYCDGRLRWFVFCGELIGWVLFRLVLGSWFVALGSGILDLIIRLVTGIIKLVLRVIRLLIKTLIAPFLILFRVLGVRIKTAAVNRVNHVKKVCRNRKFRLKKQVGLLYNRYIPHLGGRLHRSKQGGVNVSKRKKRKANWLVRLFMLCFVGFVAVSLIGMQVEVTSKRRQLLSLQQNVEQQKRINAETQRLLSGENDEEYIERVARDKLGYAYPDEKIFIDRSGN
ncbi:MAG TPA: spore cortex biosynthesis protein YabQ [Clostridia bacterium]|nr:spore cortex biosynthesis protein YabQ [Clostridia bacterium]